MEHGGSRLVHLGFGRHSTVPNFNGHSEDHSVDRTDNALKVSGRSEDFVRNWVIYKSSACCLANTLCSEIEGLINLVEEISKWHSYCRMLFELGTKRSIEGFKNVWSGQNRNALKFMSREGVAVKEISALRNQATPKPKASKQESKLKPRASHGDCSEEVLIFLSIDLADSSLPCFLPPLQPQFYLNWRQLRCSLNFWGHSFTDNNAPLSSIKIMSTCPPRW